MDEMIRLNVVALARLTYAAVPGFVARGGGTVINIASVVAVSPEALNGVYGGSKAFALAFSQSLQHELAPKGVDVQAVLPGAAERAAGRNGRARDLGHRSRGDQRDLRGNWQAPPKTADRQRRVETAGVNGAATKPIIEFTRAQGQNMVAKASVTSKSFQGIRIEVDTSVPFDEVLRRLRGLMGDASVPAVVTLAKEVTTQAEYVRKVEERFVGESGFMLFHEIDHGGWLPKFGISRRTVRWILGNPLIAVTMIRHDIKAGLFAPVEVLVTEKESEPGAVIAYVRPSSLMVIEENPPLREAAKVLDEKLDALVAKATGT